jgi:hypothetical protein
MLAIIFVARGVYEGTYILGLIDLQGTPIDADQPRSATCCYKMQCMDDRVENQREEYLKKWVLSMDKGVY